MKIKLFSKNDELYLLLTPFVGLAAVVYFLVTSGSGSGIQIDSLSAFIIGLIFFDSIHVVFTFVLIFCLPELKTWVTHSQLPQGIRQPRLSPLRKIVIIAIVFAILFWVLRINPETFSIRGMLTVFLFIEVFGNSQHTILQIRGISQCYNAKIRNEIEHSSADLSKSYRSEFYEKVLFNVLLIGEFFYWIPTIFNRENLIFQGTVEIQNVGAFLISISALGLIVNAFYYPNRKYSYKFVYLFRAILFPLKILNVSAAIALKGVHGAEYITIYRALIRNSEASGRVKRKIFILTIACSLLYLAVSVIAWKKLIPQFSIFSASDKMIIFALMITFVIRFTHFYIDTILFKMSDSFTRATIKPLLIDNRHN